MTDWEQIEDMRTEDAFSALNNRIIETLDIVAPEQEKTIPKTRVITEKWMTRGLMKSSKTCNKLYKKTLAEIRNEHAV